MTVPPIKSIAIIGAGASGAAAAAAFAAEACFDRIRVFERRETPGGTWIYDPGPKELPFVPGASPPDIDPPLTIPDTLPKTTAPSSQERFDRTPIYDDLTTNVPAIAMCLSDIPFPYGPFTPHWVPQQYISNYFSSHRTDSLLSLSTTVEDLSRIPAEKHSGRDSWKLVLRRHDAARNVDVWWEERFDAVILANGHYSVPIVPHVTGLDDYRKLFPGRVSHSKTYRNPEPYRNKKVVVIGNSASGHDITAALVGVAQAPIYQSRRSRSRWDGPTPPEGVEWKPVIKEFRPNGDVVFGDGSKLSSIDAVIYCTGYRPSFPFWNAKANGGPIYDYVKDGLIGTYQHTFFQKYPNLGIVGMPRVLTFRSFEYQAIALARFFAGRNALPLPPREAQQRWEKERWKLVKRERRKFHDIPWDDGETMDWLRLLFETAGLPLLEGQGKCPPVLGYETRWAIEHIKKYPDYGDGDGNNLRRTEDDGDESWTFLNHGDVKDSLHFI
ncbi:dimethylaniline monooxygenase (N-oxide forming) [Exophiala viscosa]|uniref:Dimethylaniline monooxygenase (N-oxide forming) n=1 Tax=Exophiala viscosa TaxID=2486360 RepID=A0AAN6IH65_9EURO|nr:dimethylaniline monooxygenase (N-oxide forming) [Exophiala viscosa]